MWIQQDPVLIAFYKPVRKHPEIIFAGELRVGGDGMAFVGEDAFFIKPGYGNDGDGIFYFRVFACQSNLCRHVV